MAKETSLNLYGLHQTPTNTFQIDFLLASSSPAISEPSPARPDGAYVSPGEGLAIRVVWFFTGVWLSQRDTEAFSEGNRNCSPSPSQSGGHYIKLVTVMQVLISTHHCTCAAG